MNHSNDFMQILESSSNLVSLYIKRKTVQTLIVLVTKELQKKSINAKSSPDESTKCLTALKNLTDIYNMISCFVLSSG